MASQRAPRRAGGGSLADGRSRLFVPQVTRAHGNTGTVRAKFRKNLPPSSLVSGSGCGEGPLAVCAPGGRAGCLHACVLGREGRASGFHRGIGIWQNEGRLEELAAGCGELVARGQRLRCALWRLQHASSAGVIMQREQRGCRDRRS